MIDPPLEFEDLQIKVPWGIIAGRWYGNRKVRPILALHGVQDNLGTWNTLIPLLPRHIGIICVDFPGHGRSSRYPKGMNYHVVDYVHTIQRVIKEYKWDKVSLMGHSMGALVCSLYAAWFPETIDLLIQIDLITSPYHSPAFQLDRFAIFTEKLLIENERYDDAREPPSYYFSELEEILHRGSGKSVNKENCKHLIERSCSRSVQNPEKLYFSRDPRVKFYIRYAFQYEYRWQMMKSIKNLNYMVIKASASDYVNRDSLELIKLIRENNPNFEFYELEGTHHIHLNNPREVAAVIAPFICKYRSPENCMKATGHAERDENEKFARISKL